MQRNLKNMDIKEEAIKRREEAKIALKKAKQLEAKYKKKGMTSLVLRNRAIVSCSDEKELERYKEL